MQRIQDLMLSIMRWDVRNQQKKKVAGQEEMGFDWDSDVVAFACGELV